MKAELRAILLLLCLVCLLAWVLWERRRPRQARGESLARNEPTLGTPPSTEALALRASARPDRSPLPPIVAVPAAEATLDRDEGIEADRVPVYAYASPADEAPPEPEAPDTEAPGVPADAPQIGRALPAVAPALLTVDWPPESQRRIVAMRLVPSGDERFSGRVLRQGLAAVGFQHGRYDIFHLADEQGRALISAANLASPGTFEPATMDYQRLPGLSLFAVLPGARLPEQIVRQLGETALEVAQRVGGRVLDERGQPLEVASLAALEQSVQGLGTWTGAGAK